MPSGLCYLKSLDRSLLSIDGVCGWFSLLPCFIEIPIFNANSVDPDQMQRSSMSDMGLHCLPVVPFMGH